MRRQSLVVLTLLAGSAMAGAAPAAAGVGTGCPAAPGWEELTVEAAAATVWPALVDQSPWSDEADFRESAVRPYDRDGDGSICLRTIWDDLNPQSHWAGVLTFIPRDNNSNASSR